MHRISTWENFGHMLGNAIHETDRIITIIRSKLLICFHIDNIPWITCNDESSKTF